MQRRWTENGSGVHISQGRDENSILILDKTGFRIRRVVGDNGNDCRMLKGSSLQEYLSISNGYVPRNRGSAYSAKTDRAGKRWMDSLLYLANSTPLYQ